MCMNVWPACVLVHQALVWCPWRSEEGIGSSETRVADGGELPCGCWQSNPHSLKEKSSLRCWTPQPLILMFWHFQLTFKSSFWGEKRQQEGARLEQGWGQQMGTPALEGRERGAPGPCWHQAEAVTPAAPLKTLFSYFAQGSRILLAVTQA